MAVDEAQTFEECAIRIRGNVHSKGAQMARGFLQVATIGTMPAVPKDRSGRRELAAWLTDVKNPLAARVYVNRVWHHLFDAGLVRTVDNFGSAGEEPSHPELLDHLARGFMREGWSTKQLVRQIVLSHTYRMAHVNNPTAAAVDPENRLLWRANRKRLEAECLRDTILAAAGSLDRQMFGPTIRGFGRSNKTGEPSREYEYVFDDARRSVYTPVLRNRLPELFEAFDFSDPNQPIGARSASTTSPQALVMMNGAFVLEQSRRAAQRLLEAAPRSEEDCIETAYRTVLNRPPTAREKEIVLKIVGSDAPSEKERETAAAALPWERLYQALFSSVEFRYIE
jgi:hypothetical protein